MNANTEMRDALMSRTLAGKILLLLVGVESFLKGVVGPTTATMDIGQFRILGRLCGIAFRVTKARLTPQELNLIHSQLIEGFDEALQDPSYAELERGVVHAAHGVIAGMQLSEVLLGPAADEAASHHNTH
ncbi:MAG: hypothetical protein ACREVL_05085 [Solimonas sp.]